MEDLYLSLRPFWPDDRLAEDGLVLCLNFANTLSWRGRSVPEEGIPSLSAWLDWLDENGALPSEALAELRRRATMWAFEAEAAHRRTLEFRDSLIRALLASIEGKSGHDPMLRNMLAQAMERNRLSVEWRWVFEASPVDWDLPLYPIVLSLAQLLSSSDAVRLRACEREECGWFFLDNTKNHSRRWCDMSSCGNVMKARRSYAKRRKAATVPPSRSA